MHTRAITRSLRSAAACSASLSTANHTVPAPSLFGTFKDELYATAEELYASEFSSEQPAINKVLSSDSGSRRSPAGETGTANLVPVEQPRSAWERLGDQIVDTPIGHAAGRVSNAVNDAVFDAREFWETSQSPLVVWLSSVHDDLFAETELGTSIRLLRVLDPGFNVYVWTEGVRKQCLPEILGAHLRSDAAGIEKWCSERMVRVASQLRSEQEASGLHATGSVVLAIEQTELIGAHIGETGSPTLLIHATVQQVHCLRDSKGVIVEGEEDHIERVEYFFAFERNFNEDSGVLAWQCVEFAPVTSERYY